MWTYQSWFKTTLALPLAAADTSMTVATAPTVTEWRLYIKQWNIEEWVSFTWVSGTSITGLTRWLSQTADPATAWTWKAFIAWATVKIVAMHDQLQDKQSPVATVYADTTARDAALWWDWVATKAYTDVYTTSEWVHRNYNLSSNQWESVDTWTTTPNASTTVAGKWELPTQAESNAWTATWWTWWPLIWTPETNGRSVQAWAWTYDEDTWASDAYVITLSPAPTAYTEWMMISVKIWAWNTNTWASTINVNSLWAKAIQDRDWDALSANQLMAAQVYDMRYDGTQFRLITIEKASDSDVTTWTDTVKYASPKQLKDTYWQLYWTTVAVALETKTSSGTYDYEITIWTAWEYYEVWFTIWAWNTAGSPDAQAESAFVKWLTWWDKTVWTSWTSDVNFWTQPGTPVFPTWSRKLTLPAVTYWSDSATVNSITINWSWNLVINYTATLAAWWETQIDCYYANITN